MSPRPYRAVARRAAAERTRARIIAATRDIIVTGSSPAGFTIDGVAGAAGVARMTVYYQFGSKRGLLEAVFDDLAARGLATRLPLAFGAPDPLDGLARLIAAFCEFWASDPVVIRRIRSLAALDRDFDEALRTRDQRRRDGIQRLLQRLAHEGRPASLPMNDAIDLIHTLTSFETFDSLAGDARNEHEIESLVRRLVQASLHLETA